MRTMPSPLKCRGYFVTELMVTANPEYDAKTSAKLDFKDLQVEASAEAVPNESGTRVWRVMLHVRQNVGPEKNAPYNFGIVLLGHFEVHPEYPDAKIRQLVSINGSSILYSAARQILRDAMHNGPFDALLLPTVSFSELPQDVTPPKVAEANADYGITKA